MIQFRIGVPGSPVKMSLTPSTAASRAPLWGEHSEDVRWKLGYARDHIIAHSRLP
jgi:crotonobetainyl-CoA:carnitine CoA-transferase CaiB-like acyl-CoA transferase